MPPPEDPGCGAKVRQTRIGAGADEDVLHGNVFHRHAGLKSLIGEPATGGCARNRIREGFGFGNRLVNRRALVGTCAPGDHRPDARSVDRHRAVVDGAFVGRERPPEAAGGLKLLSRKIGHMGLDPRSRLLVGRDQGASGARLDREVAERHAALDRKRVDRAALILDHVTERTTGAYRAKHRERQILGRAALGQHAVDADQHRLRQTIDERLRRENVLDFRGPDPESEGAERPVGRGVTVAADDDHAGTHQSLLGHHDVLDALMWVVRAVEGVDAVAAAVGLERFGLTQRGRVGNDARRDVRARNDVVHDAEVRVGNGRLHASLDEARKRLRARVFVRKMQIDIEQHGVRVDRAHHVLVENLPVQSSGHRDFSKRHPPQG